MYVEVTLPPPPPPPLEPEKLLLDVLLPDELLFAELLLDELPSFKSKKFIVYSILVSLPLVSFNPVILTSNSQFNSAFDMLFAPILKIRQLFIPYPPLL